MMSEGTAAQRSFERPLSRKLPAVDEWLLMADLSRSHHSSEPMSPVDPNLPIAIVGFRASPLEGARSLSQCVIWCGRGALGNRTTA